MIRVFMTRNELYRILPGFFFPRSQQLLFKHQQHQLWRRSSRLDAGLLSTCLVPLQYQVKGGPVLFQNPKPQGTTFCQPVRLEYRKEIDAWIDAANAFLVQTPHLIDVGPKKIKFLHKLLKTMLSVFKREGLIVDRVAGRSLTLPLLPGCRPRECIIMDLKYSSVVMLETFFKRNSLMFCSNTLLLLFFDCKWKQRNLM